MYFALMKIMKHCHKLTDLVIYPRDVVISDCVHIYMSARIREIFQFHYLNIFNRIAPLITHNDYSFFFVNLFNALGNNIWPQLYETCSRLILNLMLKIRRSLRFPERLVLQNKRNQLIGANHYRRAI